MKKTTEKCIQQPRKDALDRGDRERPPSQDTALQNAIEAACRARTAAGLADAIVREIDRAPAGFLAKVTCELEENIADLMYLVSGIARYTGAELRWRLVEAVTQRKDDT